MSKTLCHDDSGCLCCNSYDIITYPFTLWGHNDKALNRP
jgi:hypothetical protein